MVCPMVSVPNTQFAGLGSTAELCGPVSLSSGIDLSASGVAATEIRQWLGLRLSAPISASLVTGQGILFPSFTANAGSHISFRWTAANAGGAATVMAYVLDGQTQVVQTSGSGGGTAGGASGGVVTIPVDVTGDHSLGIAFLAAAQQFDQGLALNTALFVDPVSPHLSLTGVTLADSPEPATMFLTGSLLVALGAIRRKAD